MTKQIKRGLRLNYDPFESISVSVASTFEDLQEAHRLCYEIYLAEGYAAENIQKMRLTLHHMLPTTTTFVAKDNGKIIGTLMAISDGPLGLPCDSFFDVNSLRQDYGRLVEGSGYAIDKKYRGDSGKVFFLLYKYFFKFAEEYLAADCTLAAINPKQYSFYKNILLFEDYKTEVVKASSANGAPAIMMKLDLETYRDKYLLTYANEPAAQNLYKYVFDFEIKNLIYPNKKSFLTGYPSLNPQVMQKVFDQRSELFSVSGESKIQTLRNILPFNSYDNVFTDATRGKRWQTAREYRISSRGYVQSICGISLMHKALIKDVSENGLLVKYKSLANISVGSLAQVEIEIDDKTFCLELEVVWAKNYHVGYCLVNPSIDWINFIREGKEYLVRVA